MRTWSVTSEPSEEPVLLAELKAQIREDENDQDDFLDSLIPAARKWVENTIERAIIDQEITLKLDGFPDGEIILPRTNLISVTSITYQDEDDVEQTVATSVYGVDTFASPGRVFLKSDQVWPTDLLGQRQVVTIVYQAGWKDRQSVPPPIKQAVLLLAGHWEANREAVLTGSIQTELSFTLTALLDQYRVFSL